MNAYKAMPDFKRMYFLEEFENRDSFFKRISWLFPKRDKRYKLIERAYNDAKDAFRGVYRADKETRYFEHIRATALILIEYLRVKDHELIVAALLHDIVEDVPSWTTQRIENEYGEQVALLVDYLTKPDESNYSSKQKRNELYHARFRFAPREFFLIKLADRFHNLYTLWNCSKQKQERKVEETEKYYLPHAEKHLILYHEMEKQIEILREEEEDEGSENEIGVEDGDEEENITAIKTMELRS